MTTCTTVVLALLVALVSYNVYRAICYKGGTCGGSEVPRTAALSFSFTSFVIVIKASVIMRISARSGFDSQVSSLIGRKLVMSSVRIVELTGQLLEFRARKHFAEAAGRMKPQDADVPGGRVAELESEKLLHLRKDDVIKFRVVVARLGVWRTDIYGMGQP